MSLGINIWNFLSEHLLFCFPLHFCIFACFLMKILLAKRMNYWVERNVPGPEFKVPILSDILYLYRTGIRESSIRNYNTFKQNKIYGTFEMGKPVLGICDPETIKLICTTYSKQFTNKDVLSYSMKPFDKSLIALKDNEWRRVKNLLTPSFSPAKLKNMHSQIQEACQSLDKFLELQVAKNAEVDIKTTCGNYVLDVAAKTLFGLNITDMQDNSNHIFGVYAHQAMKDRLNLTSPKALIGMFFPSLASFLELEIISSDASAFFRYQINRAVEERINNNNNVGEYNDLLTNMINSVSAGNDGSKKGLTKEEMYTQCLSLLIAGYDTSATAMQFLAYCLSENIECQNKCYEEMASLNKEHLDHSDIMNLSYLQACVKEALRLFSPAPVSYRLCNETCTIKGITIEEGVSVQFPMFAISRDPNLWPNPTQFQPERFLTNQSENLENLSIPFGLGPRKCIGQRFALTQVYSAFATILLKYELLPGENNERVPEIQLSKDPVTTPAKPIMIQLKKR